MINTNTLHDRVAARRVPLCQKPFMQRSYMRESIAASRLDLGVEARIIGLDDTAIISVNNSSTATRQRFSIGHELGHWMNDRGQIDLGCNSDKQERYYTGTDKESLANAFATELLLPSNMFVPRLASGRQL